MCGIFGIFARDDEFGRKELVDLLEELARLSQVRGKDSSGMAFRFESTQQIHVLKGPVSIDRLLKTKEYKEFRKSVLRENGGKNSGNIFAALGHARLVTNGSQLVDINNQPVVKDGIAGVHNGIIVNDKELWTRHPDMKREYGIDTEVMFSLFRKHLTASGDSIEAIKLTDSELFGTVSTGFFIDDRDEFLAYTNNGSLYILTDRKNFVILGSEKVIVKRLLKKFGSLLGPWAELIHVPENKGFLVDFRDFGLTWFDLKKEISRERTIPDSGKFRFLITNHEPKEKQLDVIVDPGQFINKDLFDSERKMLEYNLGRISALKRCTRCLLPETFPFIEFDTDGVCNICNNHRPLTRSKQIDELKELVAPYRKNNGQPDCLVPFSGGRDSTYVLHIVKNILNLNPIAFTYDWGMVTDLGRRNIARVCGKLGVENIIISANIHWKRENIRKNISAWLKNPELGMIPLFMSGDKYFFYYTHKVKKQNDIKLNIWGINPLENTDFKVGFCGLPLRFNKKRIYSISLADQLRLFSFFGRNLILSPSYINQSLFDTLGSYMSRYLGPKRDYYHLFDYYSWDEKEIEDLIKNNYLWETALDTKTTWRIGDGTAAFYNYIYYTVAGFSEYDTFRSNQIREGMLSREEAVKLVNDENFPRYESIKWYLEIIGLDYRDVIKRINQIKKLY